MTKDTDYPQQNKYIQKGLFDFSSKGSSNDLSLVIDDSARDEILVSLLALASVKGIDIKTVYAMFDIGFLCGLSLSYILMLIFSIPLLGLIVNRRKPYNRSQRYL